MSWSLSAFLRIFIRQKRLITEEAPLGSCQNLPFTNKKQLPMRKSALLLGMPGILGWQTNFVLRLTSIIFTRRSGCVFLDLNWAMLSTFFFMR